MGVSEGPGWIMRVADQIVERGEGALRNPHRNRAGVLRESGKREVRGHTGGRERAKARVPGISIHGTIARELQASHDIYFALHLSTYVLCTKK